MSARRTTTSTRRQRRAAVALASLAVLATAACGQKDGVSLYVPGTPVAGAGAGGFGAPGTAGAPGEGGFAAGGGAGAGGGFGAGGSGAGGGFAAGGSGSTAGGGAGGTGGSGGSTGEGGGAIAAPGAPAGGGDTTGVTDTTITIGLHAPVTGAAAIPQQSFERAVGVYFDAVNRAGGIAGREVEVIFRDDGFDPNRARSVCKEMVEQEEVFLLIGGGGADQIDACARYAETEGVPYLSAGVHETRPGLGALADVDTYFALSLTYEQQVPLLARLVRSQFAGERVAVIVADNDSLDNFYGQVDAAVEQVAGDDLVLSRRIPKNTTSDAPAIGTAICQSQARAVVWNASPSSLLNVAKAMPCRVTFIGPGLSNGLNVVAQIGCPEIQGALFYSPFPGLDVMRRNSAFVNAYRASNGGAEPDDLGAAIYGTESLVGEIFKAAGRDLSRESFIGAIARKRTFDTGVYPRVQFDSRFGGTAMHLLRADCSRSEYTTVRQSERP